MSRDLILAADLGTGGCKAALYDTAGRPVVDTYQDYRTSYPSPGRHEQRPADWWHAFQRSIGVLMGAGEVRPSEIRAISLSGQSLALVPLDADGRTVLDSVPIWSDARATDQAARFFETIGPDDWYLRTGNGFPPHLYTLFELMWLRDHRPDQFRSVRTILGSKDYLNFRLTGERCTDPSYASGSGIYDIVGRHYDATILAASGIDASLWPTVLPSSTTIGYVLPSVAGDLGLPDRLPVVAGGVDNACMALGAGAAADGRMFCALGSSNWVTVATEEPVLDVATRSYVFDHVVPGLYVSAESTFGGGSSVEWARERLLGGIPIEAMMEVAEQSPVGANGLLCVPALAGGTVAEGGSLVRGALLGLDLSHTTADIARAFLEGVALALTPAFSRMRRHGTTDEGLRLVGGGSRSPQWRRILADAFQTAVVTSDVNQQAATLGAASVALVGLGYWSDFTEVDQAHGAIERTLPNPDTVPIYARLTEAYLTALADQAALAERLAALRSGGDPPDGVRRLRDVARETGKPEA